MSQVAVTALALAIATIFMGDAQAAARHTGGGIARRAAFHERQREERAELEAAVLSGLRLVAVVAAAVLCELGRTR